eukprot:3028577-Pleurochrysis_carterae.AAC.1
MGPAQRCAASFYALFTEGPQGKRTHLARLSYMRVPMKCTTKVGSCSQILQHKQNAVAAVKDVTCLRRASTKSTQMSPMYSDAASEFSVNAQGNACTSTLPRRRAVERACSRG